MRQNALLVLHNEITGTTDDTSAEVDLAPYIHVGGREMAAFLAVNAVPSTAVADPATSTDVTVDYSLQESATTASSDFAAISGASFTQSIPQDAETFETIYFQASQRYVRGVAAIAGTTPNVGLVSGILAVKRATT